MTVVSQQEIESDRHVEADRAELGESLEGDTPTFLRSSFLIYTIVQTFFL